MTARVENLLKSSNAVFVSFFLCGFFDIVSTIILIARNGIGVEANPLIRFGVEQLGFLYFLPHMMLVGCAAFMLSRPSWNNESRMKAKLILLHVYLFVLINNWYQVLSG